MGWDAFEAFCCALIARLPKVRECHHYGTQGDTQLGIDLFADFDSGQRWAFQNKRLKQFGKAAVAKAIKATTYKADRYIILLSRQATVETRKAIANRRKWDIWDVRDLSRKVRELPLDDARRLLDDHFGGAVRRAFLGVSGVSTFPTHEVFFRPLLDATKLFNHTWSLVGRANQLQQLHAFVESTSQRVAILSGRGGIGKSKVLHVFGSEFLPRHESWAMRFVGEELPLTTDTLDDLPAAPCVVVVDDAHRREDLGVLLAYLQQRTQPIKLVFSARQQGLDNLNYLLRNTGLDPQQIAHIEPVTDLTRDEVRQLAVQVLGEDHEHLADRLTSVTKDCPLVTVVGGKLLVQKKVEPQLLERDADFRAAALGAYRDVLVGNLGDRIASSLCRGLLNLIAAVAPVRPENEAFQTAGAEFLGVEVNQFIEAMSVLEMHGILLRRGYSVRITPDVLADHLLHEACLTPQGNATGFAKLVYQHFGMISPTQVFRNLAELDWRVYHTSGEETNLLVGIWQDVREGFEGSNNLGRCTMLDLVKEVAYYQPDQVLELVEFAVHNPTSAPEPEWSQHFHAFTHENVRRKLPELIRRIAFSFRHLPRCCDLLWELAKDDDRKLNPYPDHPLRVLTELAEYDPDKPLEYNQAVLEAAGRWLAQGNSDSHLHSPLDVIDPLLAKTGTIVRGHRHGIVMRSAHWPLATTQPFRDGALSLIVGCLDSPQLKVVLRALQSIEEALREPVPYLNMTLSVEDRTQWTPHRLYVLGILEKCSSKVTAPIIQLRLLEILRRAALYGSADEIKRKAHALLTAIPDSFDLRLARLLCQNLHDLCYPDEDEDGESVSWQDRQQRANALGRAVATEFLQKHANAKNGFDTLNAMVVTIQQSGREVHPWLILHAISELDGGYSDQLCEQILKSPDCVLAPTFGSLIAKLRRRDLKRADQLISTAIRKKLVVLCRAVANEYWTQRWLENARPQDLKIADKLVAYDDFGVKRLTLMALPSLAKTNPQAAITLALKVEVGACHQLADELCATFTRDAEGIEPALLTSEDLASILSKLAAISRIDGHYVQKFLAYAAKRDPQAVLDLLLQRIESEDTPRGRDARALPFDGFHFPLEGLVESERYQDFLRAVRDRMQRATGMGRYYLPKLFKDISFAFSPASLQVLSEWVTSGDPTKIEVVGSIVSEASHAFVFEQIGFVTALIDRALAAGNTCHRRVLSALANSAKAQSRQGVSGQPFPQDIALRDRAAALAQTLTPGTPIRRFFEGLKQYAEGEIRDQTLRDEEADA